MPIPREEVEKQEVERGILKNKIVEILTKDSSKFFSSDEIEQELEKGWHWSIWRSNFLGFTVIHFSFRHKCVISALIQLRKEGKIDARLNKHRFVYGIKRKI